MKKAILIPLSSGLILAGSLIPLQFAHSDTQTEGNTLLAAKVGSDAWREENRQAELREIRRQDKRMKEAERQAEKARNEKQWNRAQKKWEDAAKKKWEAKERLEIPLEPIPK